MELSHWSGPYGVEDVEQTILQSKVFVAMISQAPWEVEKRAFTLESNRCPLLDRTAPRKHSVTQEAHRKSAHVTQPYPSTDPKSLKEAIPAHTGEGFPSSFWKWRSENRKQLFVRTHREDPGEPRRPDGIGNEGSETHAAPHEYPTTHPTNILANLPRD